MDLQLQHGTCRTILLIFIGSLLLVTMNACVTAVTLNPEFAGQNTDLDVLVSTKDSLKYSFPANAYIVITDSAGNRYIRGEGKVYRGEGSQFRKFNGAIAFSNIQSITVSQETVFFYLSIAFVAITILVGVMFAISLGGRGFGG